jgi:hypothetical protein
VTFLTGSEYESAIFSVGAIFIPLDGSTDTVEEWIWNTVKEGIIDKPDVWTRELFIEQISRQWEGVKRVLKNIRQRKGDEEGIVVLVEGAFRGCLPGMLGAPYPGPVIKGWIGVGIITFILTSPEIVCICSGTFFSFFEWAGAGINLRTEEPTQEMLQRAVAEVFADLKNKRRAREIQAEMQKYDPLGTLTEAIEELAGREQLRHAEMQELASRKSIDNY